MTIQHDEADVQAYLDAADTENDLPIESCVDAILSRLAERVKGAGSGTDKLREIRNSEEALARLADETGEPGAIIEHVDREAQDIAQSTGQKVKTGTIRNDVLEKTREVDRELRERTGIEFEIDGDSVGFDRYLEEHIVRVVKLQSTDHVSDVTTRFEFVDGNAVECNDEYQYWEPFYRKVEPDADPDLDPLPEFASEKVLTTVIEDNDGDITDTESVAYDLYCEHSLGPETRPWSPRSKLWTRAIKDLIKTHVTEKVTPGPRTQAWNKLVDKISAARATTNLDDATVHGEVYVDETLDEVWVPTKIVASVVEEVEITRQDLSMELAAIGVASDHLPGDQVVDRQNLAGGYEAFWRLDASFTGTDTHDATPEPGTIVDSISTGGAGNMAGGPAAADGGVYGRNPNAADEEEDTDGDDSDSETGGDDE